MPSLTRAFFRVTQEEDWWSRRRQFVNCTTQVLSTVQVRMLCLISYFLRLQSLTPFKLRDSILEIGESMHVPIDSVSVQVSTNIVIFTDASGVLVPYFTGAIL
jgi:hypothetical protein